MKNRGNKYNYCSYCGRIIRELPFRCKYCHKIYCNKHRLPEDHKCKELEEYNKGSSERWRQSIKNGLKRKSFRQPYKPNISIRSKLRKLWWRNKKGIKRLLIWVIILGLVYYSFQYYQNNEEKVNNLLNQASNWFEPSHPPHNISINKSYSVNVNGLNKIEITLHKEVYDYFKHDASKEYTYYGSSPPSGWEVDYWKMFLTNKEDEYIMEDILKQTVEATNSEGDKAVNTLVRFVQRIPYDWDSFYLVGGTVRYPYETLYDNKGICAEKSLLLAKLLQELNYGVALFNYANENHMAVGIECPYDKSNFQTGYCFIESTDIYPIGKIPQEYVGGVDIRNKVPQIIIVSKGKVYSG